MRLKRAIERFDRQLTANGEVLIPEWRTCGIYGN